MSRRLGRLLRNSLTSTTTLVHWVLGGFFMRARWGHRHTPHTRALCRQCKREPLRRFTCRDVGCSAGDGPPTESATRLAKTSSLVRFSKTSAGSTMCFFSWISFSNASFSRLHQA